MLTGRAGLPIGRTGFYHPVNMAPGRALSTGGGITGSPPANESWLIPITIGDFELGITGLAVAPADALDGGGLQLAAAIYEADENWDLTLLVDAGTHTKSTSDSTGALGVFGGATFTEEVLGPRKQYVFAIAMVAVQSSGTSVGYFRQNQGVWPYADQPWGTATSTTSASIAAWLFQGSLTGSAYSSGWQSPLSNLNIQPTAAYTPPLLFAKYNSVSAV